MMPGPLSARCRRHRNSGGGADMATQNPGQPGGDGGQDVTVTEVELLRVMVSRQGTQVSAQWAIHPQIKRDLLPEEWKKVADLMARVTALVGKRFAQVLDQTEPDRPGTA